MISIAADESFEPIIQEEIDVFESLYPLAGIVPRYTTEVEAINLLLKDSVRLAIATRTLTEEEMNSFHSRKFFPREIKLATDGLALIVNRDNPDSLLTVRDFSRILTGEAKDWKDINPNSRLKSIQVVFDNKNSSTVRYTMDSICGGKPLATDNVSALKTNQQVCSREPRSNGSHWCELAGQPQRHHQPFFHRGNQSNGSECGGCSYSC